MFPDFEQVPHTADLQMRAYGATIKELFRNALIGMFQLMRPLTSECTYSPAPKGYGGTGRDHRLFCPQLPIQREIMVQSIDQDALLVDFLSEALSCSAIYHEAYLDVTIHELDSNRIRARLHGIPITGFQAAEIKAVTYHDLHIIKKDEVWQSDVVFDI